MNRFSIRLLLSMAATLTVPLMFAQADIEGSRDYPGLTRMPGYYIAEYSETAFDSYSFKVTKAANKQKFRSTAIATISVPT